MIRSESRKRSNVAGSMASILTTCGEALASGAGILYGLMYLSLALAYSITQRETWLGQNEEDVVHLRNGKHALGPL